jgi:uncharacterized protein YkwD
VEKRPFLPFLLAACAVPASLVFADPGAGTAKSPPGEPEAPSAATLTERLCETDEFLTAAASRLAETGKAPASGRLTREVRASGSDAVSVRALWLPGSDGDRKLSAWLQAFRERADAPLVCGEARSPAGRLVIATARGGSLAPPDGGAAEVRGWLERGFDSPELVVSDDTGEIRRYRISNAELRRGVPIEGDLRPPLYVQLVASGRAGPRPVAERLVGGGDGRSEPEQPEQKAEVAAATATILTLRLNRLRKLRGALTVRENRLLAELATRHARAVCESGRTVHEIEPGLDPESRLALAGVRARTVGETVARSGDAITAFEAMRNSPSHLMTMVDARFTDAGVGLATDQSGHCCAVVLLAAWPRYVGK